MARSILITAMAALSLASSPVASAVPHSGTAEISAVDQTASYDRKGDRRGPCHHGSYGNHRHDQREYRHHNHDRYRHHERCRRDNGTAGLLIGGAIGGAIGNEVADEGDKTTGTLLGAAGGAIIGKNIDDGYKCR